MRSIVIIFLSLLAAYVALPYYTLYELDHAVMENDRGALAKLVDLAAVRESSRSNLMGESPRETPDNPVSTWFQDGVELLGKKAINALINLDWVRNVLRSKNDTSSNEKGSMLGNVSYAFFEGIDRFVFRVGQLGQQPVHVRMERQGWDWRVTALFE
ncbi:MAG: DUF2939 domain-containing protein [Chromatiales bacterium]|nr:DUF2939 domain-containing protein [Chromatiales bacterium]